MKGIGPQISLSLALGGVGAAVATYAPMDAPWRGAALVGCLVAAAIGAVAMLMKGQFVSRASGGTAAVRLLLTAQVFAMLLRLAAVGLGAVLFQLDGRFSPVAFVVAFLAVSLIQQVFEMRSLLAARQPLKSESV